MKRYGLIGTAYNAGISHIASGFAEHLDMKTLLVDNKPFASFPSRFKNHRITKTFDKDDVDWLLKDIDVLMAIETPYEWRIFAEAKNRGIKVVFMPMIEWLDRKRPELKNVDLFLCPSKSTANLLHPSYTNVVVVPCEVPVDLAKFQPRRIIKKAEVFLHNSGHGGIGGRNSTQELIQAIPLVKSPARFIIRSQFPIQNKVEDPRITYIEGNIKNYWDLYTAGDVWIMPWKYGVAALGLQESMAAGMIPVITNMEPFNTFMPKELLITPKKLEMREHHAGQKELYADQDPILIAEKIDELYNMNITKLVDWARDTALEWSWYEWKSKYIEIFDTL